MSGPPPRHRWQDWIWDETLFAGAADYYQRGRKPYSPAIVDALAEHVHLHGAARLLDLGCGPGTVTLPLARLFRSVVGLDPDGGMIAAAERAAREQGVTNASWVQMRAEELPHSLGSFAVVTIAAAFHWMDRPRVAATVRQMLEPGGAVVQLDVFHTAPAGQVVDGPYPEVPEAAIDELRRQWLGPDRRAGQGFRNDSPSGEDEIFQAAGFAPEEIVVVPDDRLLERSIDDVVAWVLSTSSTAPHLFGERLGAFVDDLRSLLLDASPSGRFSVRLSDNKLRIHRPR